VFFLGGAHYLKGPAELRYWARTIYAGKPAARHCQHREETDMVILGPIAGATGVAASPHG
jgi:hypothetical protein